MRNYGILQKSSFPNNFMFRVSSSLYFLNADIDEHFNSPEQKKTTVARKESELVDDLIRV